MFYGLDMAVGEAPVVGQSLPVSRLQLFGGQLPQDVLHELRALVVRPLKLHTQLTAPDRT